MALLMKMAGGTGRSIQLLIAYFVLSVCMSTWVGVSFSSADADIMCKERERQALLMIKHAIVDEYGHLSSWGNEQSHLKDCCNWSGILCDNQTGHIIMLDLGRNYIEPLRGKISPSLLQLQHLRYIDLSWNRFEESHIPEFIGDLKNLVYLNLSYAGFMGTIPPQLGNLSSLQVLDLSARFLDLSSENLRWLSHLSSLRYLFMEQVNLEKASDWIETINRLPSLVYLRLYGNSLSVPIPPSGFLFNTSISLLYLELSQNPITSEIYPWLFNFGVHLQYLDLSYSKLEGPLPDAFANMTSLLYLDLSWNILTSNLYRGLFNSGVSLLTLDLSSNLLKGPMPDAFGNMTSLEYVDLSRNLIEGGIPKSLGQLKIRTLDLSFNNLTGFLPEVVQNLSTRAMGTLVRLELSGNRFTGSVPDIKKFSSLVELYLQKNNLNGFLPRSSEQHPSKLQVLDISSNYLQGTISNAHFLNLPNLTYLDLSDNLISLDACSDCRPPFQLATLLLRSCKLGPHFPVWLQTQKNVSFLDISNCGISDVIPIWFWDQSHDLQYLNVSYNQIKGMLPELSFNFTGFTRILDLSSNQFEGPVPLLLSNISILNLSKNKFSGHVSNICAIKAGLVYLDLSDNLLSGQLPNCWNQWENLSILNLNNNNFSGNIPSSIGSLLHIESLHLRNNRLSGELPSSFQNCTALKLIDIGNNQLSGRIPVWIGNFSKLAVLSLRSNAFYGTLLAEICYVTELQILDLSFNSITGTIPRCISNFTAMARKSGLSIFTHFIPFLYKGDIIVDKLWVEWGGNIHEYGKTLILVKSIDLSRNKFSGRIPFEITRLSELVSLNLSRNNLTGVIPPNIGQLRYLLYLDLSRNKLFGDIPVSMSDLNFLSRLDLSNNRLSGKIPSSTQLQSFEASAFARNLALCGPPLTQKCPGDDTVPSSTSIDGSEDDDNQLMNRWFYVGAGLGFVVGFWGVCGTLFLSRSWRHAYFQFLNNLRDWVYVTTAVHSAGLRRKLRAGLRG